MTSDCPICEDTGIIGGNDNFSCKCALGQLLAAIFGDDYVIHFDGDAITSDKNSPPG